MTSFVNLPSYIQSMIGVITVILFWASAAIIVSEIKHKHWNGFACIVFVCIGLYIVTQCIFYNIHTELAPVGITKRIIEIFGNCPWIIIMTIFLVIGILEVRVFKYHQKWIREHITISSIKEAIDNLPVGICCYEPNGQVVLKNHNIEKICREYTGKALLNAAIFIDELIKKSKKTEKGSIIHLENGEVLNFLDRELNDNHSKLRIIYLADITEQYKNTETLQEKQKLVAKLNDELVLYGKQIVASITAREILEAKVKIHDELGINLLASKHYILSGGSDDERKNIEEALHRNLQYLKQEKENLVTDEYAIILETAKKLDIKLNLNGVLTDIQPVRHIIVTGIHECLTNTIRHAMGDMLNVKLEESENEINAEFTNNGIAPDGEIVERGGLLLLRTLVEKHGGIMKIESEPQFILRLTLKK